MKQKLKTAIGFGIALPIVSIVTLLGLEFNPGPTEKVRVQNTRPIQQAPANKSLTLISWNLQFAGSRKHHFFYDGGKAVHVPSSDVQSTLSEIVAVLKERNPDFALLQEIDQHSDRTGNIDQLEPLKGFSTGINWVTTPYHKVPYVPHPNHEPMGRVNLNLGTLSKYEIFSSTRHQLALLKEPRWRQFFNLKRALLETIIPIGVGANRPHLILGNTHLSAFSRGDGTLEKQISQLKAWIDGIPTGQPWILAGDFNLLPPKDTPSRLGEDANLYADAKNPISTLMNQYKSAFPEPLAEDARTYLPFGSEVPDRKIDYIFYGGPIEIESATVLRQASSISDHLPLEIRFRLTTSP